jgi:hypothetical protein
MPQPVLSANLATKASIKEWYKKTLSPLVTHVREEKRGLLHPQWLRYWRLWTLKGQEQSYHGRLRMYLPTAHRILENWVQKLRADLFPQSKRWFKVEPDSTVNEERADTTQCLIQDSLENQVKITALFPGLLRNLCIFGTAPLDLGWLHDERFVPTLETYLDKTTGRSETQEVLRSETLYLGPTMRVVDPFLFYVWPYTPQFTWQAELLFEDMLAPWDTLERMARTWIDPDRPELGHQVENLKGLKDIRATRDNSEKYEAERERLLARGLTSRSEKLSFDPRRPADTTTLYWYGSLQETKDDDTGETRPEDPTWYKLLVGGDDILLTCRQDPWWHQNPSYLAAKFAELQGEFWGYGVMFLLDHLQYFTNDTLNQTGDGLVFSLNPIVAMDANAVQFPDSIRMAPAARWLMRDPRNSLQFIEPPKDSAMAGVNVINFLIAMMNDVSNVAPFGSGLGTGAAGRARGRAVGTATGMSIISSEALLQVRDVVENIEQGILTPSLKMIYSLYQQCLDRPLLLRMEGVKGAAMVETAITRDNLVGNLKFSWQGSVFTFNQNVRVQQMLNFIQILARIPPDFLAQDNARVNWKYLLREIWATGFGDREAEQIITDIMPTRVVDAYVENELFRVGRGAEVTVSPLDQDQEHADMHGKLLTEPDLDPEVVELVMRHIQKHGQSFAMKQIQAQQQAEQAAMAQMMGGAAAGGGAGTGGPGQGPGGATGGPPGAPGPMTASRTVMPNAPGRLPQTTSDSDVARALTRSSGTPGAY